MKNYSRVGDSPMSMMKRLLLCGLLLVALPALTFAQGGVVEYYHLDALGTVRAVTNEAGLVLETHNYLPFGEELCPSGGTYVVCGTSPAGQPKRFTGKERDNETGLDYFGARYLRASTGRFTTIDPVYTWQENLGDPQRWNRYAYGRNNPLRFVDPDGKVIVPALLVIWGAVEVGLQIYDSYSTVQTLSDPNASFRDKAIAGGGVVMGAIAPEGGYGAAGKVAAGKVDDVARTISLSRKSHGEAAEHAADAIAQGLPDVLTVGRGGAPANRAASLGGRSKVAGQHLDEYPPAMFKEGGKGASVRPIKPRDNMSAGACIGNACRGLPDGSRVRIKVEDK